MSRLSTNPQSSDGMARGPAQIPVPQKWQVDQGALQMNFLATTLLTEMAKYNNIIHSYYNSMLLEQKHLKSVIYDLESIINDLQSKVQDAEIKRVKTEERLRALQVDYEQLATFHNQNPSMTPDTVDYRSATFSPLPPIQDRSSMLGTSPVTQTAITPLKVEDIC